MDKINLEKIISLYREIVMRESEINQNLKILKEIYKILGKNLEEVDEKKNNIHKFFVKKITQITEEILDSLSEDERSTFRQHLPEVISICLLSDDEKVEKATDEESDLYEYEERLIAESLNYTDKEKVQIAKDIEGNTSFMHYVVISIQDDSTKIELLNDESLILFDREKASIIESLKSDDKKIKALEFLIDEDQEYSTSVICSLKSDDKKIELIERIRHERGKALIICSMRDDNKKLDCLRFVKQARWKAIIIASSLKDESERINYLENIEDEEVRFIVIETLTEEENLLKALSYLNDEEKKARIIVRLENDDDKIEQLSKIKDEINRACIIVTIKDDDKKIKLLDTIKDEEAKVEIVQSLKDDEKKIGQLINFPYEEHRVKIIKSLKSDDKKISFLGNIKEEEYRFEIIGTIKDIDKRISAISYLETEEARSEIANTINNRRKRLEVLGKADVKYQKLYDLAYGDREVNINGKYNSFGLPKNMTIGIEIEAVGENYNLIPNDLRGWDGEKRDPSLGDNGKEFRSPVMRDREEDVKGVYNVNEILKAFGMKVTPKCGGHVHIGADYITTEEGYKQLAELWGNAEEIYYLISNKEGELPRNGIEQFARPISDVFEQEDLEKIPEDKFILNAKRIVEFRRYNSINFINVYTARNTIEFRLANGTLDGDTWVENIRLFGRTVEIAEDLGQIVGKLERGEELTEEEKTKYALKEMLKDDVPLDAKMDILMKILFTEEEREVYYKRYRTNKTLEGQEHRLEDVKFGKIDFKQVYDEIEKEKGRIEEER